jgi:glycosyltransferase involved in cell wall biosynthesis
MQHTTFIRPQWRRLKTPWKPNPVAPSHMPQAGKAPLRVLLELRPALGGHAGIPQATRLLFRNLSMLEDIKISGLLQSADRVLGRGLPMPGSGGYKSLSVDRQLNRLSRVVIAIETGTWASIPHATGQTIVMVLKHLLGGSEQLTHFEARHFQDFIWRRYFSRTLPSEDFESTTGATFRIARVPWTALHIGAMVTRRLGYSVYPRLNTSDFDVMVAETPYPGTVAKRTRLVIRYHDAIPILMPHTISDRSYHQQFHYRALRKNIESGAWFACVSDATRRDLVSIFPKAEERSLTIRNTVSDQYFNENSTPSRIPEIIKTRLNNRIKPPLDPSLRRRLFEGAPAQVSLQYLLMVSTVEPRKNHLSLLTAWERLRLELFPDLKLLIVGALGWHHKGIIRRMAPWLERGDVILLSDVLASELRLLYRHARATVCPSFGEGFDYSGVEAMKSGGAVVASDIPVHREIYGDAAEYFNPYSIEQLGNAIERVVGAETAMRRDELVARGASVAARYSSEAILPQWQSFLASAGEARK